MRTVLRYGALLLAFTFFTALRAEVASPWVSTDRTIDTSSYQSIVKGVLHEGMTDEQKSIALFNFFRQRVYHYKNIPESRDPLMTVNVLGNTLCGSQGTCMKGLLDAAGIKARVVSHPGHTFYEAFYDGQWHGFDTFTNFYILTRGDKPHVASFEELHADPTLITEAQKENRCPAGICPCGDDPMAFKDAIQVTDYEVLKLKWSVKSFSLRKGEELVRSWWPDGHALPGTYELQHGSGPIHTCGTHDRGDNPELYKYWEPYGVVRLGPTTSVSYRHIFNGYLNYAPNLTTDDFLDGQTTATGVKSSPNGLVGAGSLTVPVTCPYYITGGTVSFEVTCADDGDAVELTASADGKTWAPILSANEKALKRYKGDLSSVAVANTTALHNYQIKFELKGKATLKGFYLRTNFQHNAMAAPHLMPGKNVVSLEVANADVLAKSPLSVVYRYKDAPDWKGDVKTVEHSFAGAPLTFDAVLPESAKLPQMQDLTLRCGTLSWDPTAERKAKTIVDFGVAKSTEGWTADNTVALSHDGTGLLMEVSKELPGPQISLALKDDWKGYKEIVIEYENLGAQRQNMALRVTSNDNKKEESEIQLPAAAGKGSMVFPTVSLFKTKLNAVSKISLAMLKTPKEGCKLRILRIVLIPGPEL